MSQKSTYVPGRILLRSCVGQRISLPTSLLVVLPAPVMPFDSESILFSNRFFFLLLSPTDVKKPPFTRSATPPCPPPGRFLHYPNVFLPYSFPVMEAVPPSCSLSCLYLSLHPFAPPWEGPPLVASCQGSSHALSRQFLTFFSAPFS